MGVKGTVTDDSTGKAVPNALIQTTNVTRIGKGQRRSDLINHDVTSGKLQLVIAVEIQGMNLFEMS